MTSAAPALAAPPNDRRDADDDDDDDDRDSYDDGDDGDDDDERASTRDDSAGDVDGAEDSHLRVHVDSEALGGAWSRDRDGDDSITFGAGLARPSLLDQSVFSRPMFGFGLGWVFAHDRAVLGAKLGITADGYDLDSSSRRATAVGGRLVPYFHWMFLPERAARPYLEARVGFGGSAFSSNPGDAGRRVDRMIYPMVGAGAGVHLFPRNYFSVDLGFNVDYARPYASTTFKDSDTPDVGWRKSADVVNFGVLLGLSTWF